MCYLIECLLLSVYFYLLQIEDLVGGETDLFCGEHQRFIWESRGSRVRLVYSQLDDMYGFSAQYSMQDI